jgi:hypothetical protein
MSKVLVLVKRELGFLKRIHSQLWRLLLLLLLLWWWSHVSVLLLLLVTVHVWVFTLLFVGF